MAKAKEKAKKSSEKGVKTPKQAPEVRFSDDEDFDFGGLPKNIPFKRNIGCGG